MEQIKYYMLPEVTEDLHINEAKSSIALTKGVAAKINELVDAYNELNATRYDILNDHAQTIRQGVVYMKDNLANTIADLFTTMNNAGEIQRILDSIFTTEYVDSLNALKEHSINVKGFGAYGNGVADDTLAIQNAIEYADSHGKVVHLPAGEYLITSSIILKDVSLIGTPGTIIKCRSNDFTAIKQDVFATKFNIRDITITDGYIGLELIRGTHSVLENVNIKNCMVAMEIENTTLFNHNRFINCLFNGHTYAVKLAHSQNGTLGAMHNVFDGCHFISESGRGIITRICRDIVLSNCTFECGANSIRSELYSTFTIDNCSFKGFKKANINSDMSIFYVVDGTNTVIYNGAVYTNVEYDNIYFYGTPTDVTYGGITIAKPMVIYGGIQTFKDFAKPVKRVKYVEE